MRKPKNGLWMHNLAKQLFPICRSTTGDGVRKTLRILQNSVPLNIHEVKSGTRVFDWTVPPEWNIRDAFVADEKGNRIIDFKKSNLHVVGYSEPVNTTVSLRELQKHLHSLPDQPNAIPYVTSCYARTWGFCLSHKDRRSLKRGRYHVVIDSDLKKGSLTYGEVIIPGERKEEIFLSTYVCHPSMANNELSGPVVTTRLAMWLASRKRRYTYRIAFVPETIGAVSYLSRRLTTLQERVIAGFNLTCCGDERVYSFMPTRSGMTLADKVAVRILSRMHPDFIRYSFLDRESDERQYQSVLADIPVVSIMRSKYHSYPEYHTSLDDLRLVTPRGLEGTFDVYRACMEELENSRRYLAVVPGEPQLGKRGLYKTIGKSVTSPDSKLLVDILAYADGTNDEQSFSEILGGSKKKVARAISVLLKENLLTEI